MNNKEIREISKMCGDFSLFTKTEIVNDYDDDLEFLYIYLYVKNFYGDEAFYLYYKKAFDKGINIDMFVVVLEDNKILYIEIMDNNTVLYTTEDIKMIKAEINRYRGDKNE